mgnify:CR=1 FL=1
MELKTKPSIWERIESGNIDSLKKVVPYPIMVLRGSMRGYIIKRVKDPLRKALETGKAFGQVIRTMKIITERMPLMTKRNVLDQRTHNLMAIEKRFFEYNFDPNHPAQPEKSPRHDMLRAAWKLYKFEICHDEFYQGRHDFLIEQIVMMILTGEWVNRSPGNPLVKNWEEPEPYGGKQTIVYAIQQNRGKIIDLLGEQWQWLKEGRYELDTSNKTERV